MTEMKSITLQANESDCQAVFVPERGGNLASLKMQGKKGLKELLYQHDCFWDDTIDDLPGAWPFCFPVCARVARNGEYGKYLYDGHLYELAIHGFAWNMPWKVIAQQQDSINLRLAYTDETLKQYPFKFQVDLHYELQHNKLLCHQTYHNFDHKPMPYAAGFHPYFLTPPANQGKQDVTIQFSPQRRLQYNEALTDIIGEQASLKLPSSVANPEINEQLSIMGEDKLCCLTFPDGDCISMVAEGVEDKDLFPYVQLYTIPDKPFICVEPWMSYPNAINAVQGMRWLQPGQQESGLLTLSLT